MVKEAKYIHYCWFGNKKLSKLAKKCIKSWKKFLPEYKIICWNEDNVDINECPFIKEAYEKKMWAFVADYARVKALNEYGGIYLDTDMFIKKDISQLLNSQTFLGVEDSGLINAAIWWEKEPKSFLTNKILSLYRKQEHFDDSDIYQITIPSIITRELEEYGYRNNKNDIQILHDDICIYPREYFYPLSYDYRNNIFTENTYTVHYFNASWVSRSEKRDIKAIRKFGHNKATIIFKLMSKTKKLVIYDLQFLKRTAEVIFYPARYIIKTKKYLKANRSQFLEVAKKITSTKKDYIVFCKKDWLGVKSSTIALFGEVIEIEDMVEKDNFDILIDAIEKRNIKLVIFSAFSTGWEILAKKIKETNPDIVIKIIWHGSNANNIADYDMERFICMFNLLEKHIIKSIAFVKKSMYEQYKQLGYEVEFLANTYNFTGKIPAKNKETLHIGIYGSSYDRWTKNFYNQLAAASIIKEKCVIDIVPLTKKIRNYAKILKLNPGGIDHIIPHDQMIKRIGNNDIVLYATFAECAPMLPLECLEQEVLCITGANHHYWEGTELEKYLIEPKADNPVAIAERIKLCLSNREKILKLYKNWKKTYDKECQKLVREFLDYNK